MNQMTHRLLTRSLSAVLATLGLVATACGSAPGSSESTGSASEAAYTQTCETDANHVQCCMTAACPAGWYQGPPQPGSIQQEPPTLTVSCPVAETFTVVLPGGAMQQVNGTSVSTPASDYAGGYVNAQSNSGVLASSKFSTYMDKSMYCWQPTSGGGSGSSSGGGGGSGGGHCHGICM